MKDNVKKTAIAGGIIGLALLAFLKTKKGQEVKKQLKNNFDDLYEEVGQKLQNLGGTTKAKYDEMVEQLVYQYSQKKKLATKIALDLTSELQKKWLTFQLYYLYDEVKSALRGTDKPTQSAFNSAAQKIIIEYGKNKNLAKTELAKLQKALEKKWQDFKQQLSE